MNHDYVAKRGLTNGHVMTVYCWGRPRAFPTLPEPSARHFDTEPGARVLAHCHWQIHPGKHPALIALHGLEGSSAAHYMRGIATKAYARGFNVILLNQRNCGGTEALSQGLYHSGLTADAAHVITELSREGIDRIVVAGYSLGGNLALKLAGDYGGAPPRALRGVCAVSPVIELAECVKALERRENFIYQWNFVRGLKARMRRKAEAHPGRFRLDRLSSIRTVREFDQHFTAPHFSFDGAEEYYFRASAMRVVKRIRVPALVITAEDDPFVPAEIFRDPRLRGNPHIKVIITKHGGHCGFVAAANGSDDGYWAERQIVRFAEEVTAGAAHSGRSKAFTPSPTPPRASDAGRSPGRDPVPRV
jgi:predicted alpha/beta-fold hydrolase